ncbi:Hypothetical Protein RradSPS_2039 [Rubrobacter radiotolerans]|uniref:Uncharacterized protein n=1 Tax=Rubrobacter radiotolerans TaxID=42256 RepID=A0A023X4C4_RUBRA|nr:Hypothetical Protein RradSPS_2039 [Rubrobacter radiotolerans]
MYVEQLLTDDIETLVGENFTGVDAEWWWERRVGGVAVCQEMDPERMIAEVAGAFGRDVREVREAAVTALGLKHFEPVVLTFEIARDATVEEKLPTRSRDGRARRRVWRIRSTAVWRRPFRDKPPDRVLSTALIPEI